MTILFMSTTLQEGSTKKILPLLFKLDIHKAFDSVSWDYVLVLLRSMVSHQSFTIGLLSSFALHLLRSSVKVHGAPIMWFW
jgi:hypothetical protein